jgi:hypothetical protein
MELGLIAVVAWLPGAAQEVSKLPSFEGATIKPVDPKKSSIVGFLSQPGGRVEIGFGSVKMLGGIVSSEGGGYGEHQFQGGGVWRGGAIGIESVTRPTEN